MRITPPGKEPVLKEDKPRAEQRRGKSGGKFVDAHDLTYRGDFPVNTGGGELSVGQAGLAGGFLHVVEALRQLRGEADGHQVAKAQRALVTGIGWLNYGRNLGTTSALGLERRK